MNLANKWIRLSSNDRLYNKSYPIIALTGGIASGKTTLLDFFKSKGIPTISADQLIKDIYKKVDTVNWLSSHASEALKNKEICFKTLRYKTFSDHKFKSELETFLYRQLPEAFDEAQAKYNNIPWLIYEIPLLFERGLENKFDAVLVSWISREEQLKRLLLRDSNTDEKLANKILDEQISIDLKKEKADLVFDNSKEVSPKALDQLWENLTLN